MGRMHGVPLQNNAYNRLKTTGAEAHAKMMIACASKAREIPAGKGSLPPHLTIARYLLESGLFERNFSTRVIFDCNIQ